MNSSELTSISLKTALLTLVVILAVSAYGQQPARPGASAGSGGQAAKPPATPEAQPATEVAPTEKVVLKVGNDQVTRTDFDFVISRLNPQVQQAIARQGRRSIGEQYSMMLLLSHQAESRHVDTSPEFLRQMAIQRSQLLAQAEFENLRNKATATPEEISRYYSTHSAEFEEAQIRQVVVRKKSDGDQETVPGLAPQEARARTELIRKALGPGGDAKKLAQEFAIPNVVLIDAEPRTVRRREVPEPLQKVAFQLKDGELSDPLETPQAVVFLQAFGHRQPELKEVAAEIENTLRQQKLEASLADLKAKTPVWMDERYFAAPAATGGPAPQAPRDNPRSQP